MTAPSYGELPTSPVLGLPCAWDVATADGGSDPRGTLRLLDGDAVRAGLDCVRTGERIALSLPITEPAPGLFWRQPPDHHVERMDRNTLDDRVDRFYLQGSTHWDGLLHVGAGADGFYGGRSVDDPALTDSFGIHHWREGIIGRGVLADVGAYLEARGEPLRLDADPDIPVDVLLDTLRAQDVEVRPGTILCLRTGWLEFYRSRPPHERAALAEGQRFPGLRADRRTSEFLWDSGVAALAADNPAVEVTPGDRDVGSLHRQSLVMTGLPLGELFDFQRLAEHCRRTQAWEFLFVSVPLHVTGAVGSPANAVALV